MRYNIADLEQALIKADAAGNTNDAMALAAEIRKQRNQVPAEEPTLEPESPSMGAGIRDAAVQGATFGWGDEVRAGITAGLEALSGGDFGDTYDAVHAGLADERKAFSDANPGTAFTAELAGAAPLALAAGIPALTSKAASTIPLWLRTAGIGATEGGLYGAGTAEQDERIAGGATGAAIGAPLAVGGGYLAKKGTDIVGGVVNWAKNKLSDTPKEAAGRILRKTMEDEGLTPDQVADVYRQLGPEGYLADAGENFRAVTRAAADSAGEVKAVAKNALDLRQTGQQPRLIGQLEDSMGVSTDDLPAMVRSIEQNRSAQAKPFYDEAYAAGVELTPELESILNRSAIKGAFKKGQKIASNEGIPIDSSFGLLNQINYAKQALDTKIQKGIRAAGKVTPEIRSIIRAKNDMLDYVDQSVPSYGKARQIWSDESSYLDAVNQGRDIFKLHADDVSEITKRMPEAEKEAFRTGAIKAISDKLDDTQINADSVRRLLGTRGMQKRFANLFPDSDSLDDFIQQAQREGEFMRTRNVVSGGSPTSQNLKGQQALEGAAQTAGMAFADPAMAAAYQVAKDLLTTTKVTPDVLKELSGSLLSKGLTEEQLLKVLTKGDIGRRIGQQLGAKTPAALTSLIIPATEAAQ